MPSETDNFASQKAGGKKRILKAASLSQIARQVGCSVACVSVVLNKAKGNSRVGPRMRQKVLRAAKAMGYRPNYHARSLRQGKSFVLGLVAGAKGLHSGFWGEVIEGVNIAARGINSDLLFIGKRDDEDELDRGIRMVQEQQVDGLLVPGLTYAARLKKFDRFDIPIVAFISGESLRVPFVRTNQETGISEAVHHLASLEHRRILWVGCAHGGEIELADRKELFDGIIRKLGLESEAYFMHRELLEDASSTRGIISGWQRQFSKYLERASRPTAIIAFNEIAGMGIYKALQALGLRVPDDVSVIGFDDIYADLANPSMTVIKLPLREIGSRAVSMLSRIIADPTLMTDFAEHVERVPTSLEVKESTAVVPPGSVLSRPAEHSQNARQQVKNIRTSPRA